MSIDRDTRNKAASLLTRILEGKITNYQLEDEWPTSPADRLFSSADKALPIIIDALSWGYYDERPEMPLSRDIFEKCNPGLLERCLFFLQSDLEYKWPNFHFVRIKIPLLDDLLGREKKWQRRFEEFKSHGDFDVWPFLRCGDYERELKQKNGSGQEKVSGHVGLGKQP